MILRKPTLFIGSSSEDLDIARNVQLELDDECDTTIWNQGLFEPGKSTLESLVNIRYGFDFALIIASGNDITTSKGISYLAPRDNVMFELGLFMGSIGREKTFLMVNRVKPPKLPSDLAGVTIVYFGKRNDNNTRASIGSACQEMRLHIRKYGHIESKVSGNLTEGTLDDGNMRENVLDMLKLLVRTRKANTEIISKEFVLLIDKKYYTELINDINKFTQSLENGK